MPSTWQLDTARPGPDSLVDAAGHELDMYRISTGRLTTGIIKMYESYVGIGLSNPKNPSNVGAVLRAAGCYRVDAVFYTGERFDRAARFNTDTRNAWRSIPLTGVQTLLDDIPAGTRIVCVELAEGAIPLPAYRHPDMACYIFGPEDGTLDQEVIDRADDVVYIPTRGSMNLAATVNVVLYDRLAKSTLNIANDALIRQSRDTNNNVIVKKSST